MVTAATKPARDIAKARRLLVQAVALLDSACDSYSTVSYALTNFEHDTWQQVARATTLAEEAIKRLPYN